MEQAASAAVGFPTWSASEWLESLDLHRIVSDAILEQLRRRSSDPRYELLFVSRVGATADASMISGLLEGTSFISTLSQHITEGAKRLHDELAEAKLRADTPAPETQAANSGGKFNENTPMGGGTFTPTFGSIRDFHRGLEGLVGTPNAYLTHGLLYDHCSSADSHELFTVSN